MTSQGTPEEPGAGARVPAPPSRWRRRLRQALVTLGALAGAGLIATAATVLAIRSGDGPQGRADTVSPVVLDRQDRLLRAFTTRDGRWRLPVTARDVDPRYIAMLLAFEDRRFRSHGGVDPMAMGRAVRQLVTHRRIVSGGSTLSMQVARLLEGSHQRSAPGKLRQMLAAWQLEHRASKDEILRLYLQLAPFGGNIEGVRAASLAYLGREPVRLSIAQAALLVALPQAPEVRRPDRHPQAARRARDRVLARAVAAGVISPREAAEARAEPVPMRRRPFPRLAPHLAEAEVAAHPGQAVHRLSLDRDLQARLEDLAREHARRAGPKLSAAAIVLDHTTGEILAHVGSADYLDETRLGAIDMTTAVRSPGSTLKPLVYGLAFEAGLAHPETLIEDRPERFGVYAPKNFDEGYRGTVTIREALADSLNIPAVKTLAAVGPARLAGRLRRIGITPQLPGSGEPTLAMALGGFGMTLEDMARLYGTLAGGGEAVTLSHRRMGAPAVRPVGAMAKTLNRRGAGPRAPAPARPMSRRLLSPLATWYIADILKDAPPPASAKGGGIAYKTGTSYGFRDAWAAGFDGRHTIVVWVGRADASATPGLTGRTAAAPLLFDAFARLADRRVPLAAAPRGVLRVSTGGLPPPLRRFKEPGSDTAAQGPFLEPAPAIAFPFDRAEVEMEAGEPPEIVLKAEGGALPLVWLVDGEPLVAPAGVRELVWQPKGRGFATISVIDARGRTDRVGVRVR